MTQPPLDYFSPPKADAMAAPLRILRRTRRICGLITLAAFIFGGLNSSDRNPLQWPSVFIFMGCLFVYLLMAAIVWVTTQVQAVLQSRSRQSTKQPPDVAQK